MIVAATVIAIQAKHLFLGKSGWLLGQLLNSNGITWPWDISMYTRLGFVRDRRGQVAVAGD